MWRFPGGRLEPGETWEMAAVREVRGEAGIAVTGLTMITTPTRVGGFLRGGGDAEAIMRSLVWSRSRMAAVLHGAGGGSGQGSVACCLGARSWKGCDACSQSANTAHPIRHSHDPPAPM